jgi:Mrp family chromosome partitioning ATPase
MAQAGLKVVAVDADLRRPVLHRIFGLSNSRGLSTAILDNSAAAGRPEIAGADDAVEFLLSHRSDSGDVPSSASQVMKYLQTTEVSNLWVLPSGPLPPNPAELLGSQRLRQVLDELAWADVVLFDSPPALAVTDAMVLGVRVDGMLLVFEVGSTRRGAAAHAVEELRRVDANILGVVMNRVSPSRDGYYYYRDYYHSEDGNHRASGQQRVGLGRLLPIWRRPRDGAGKSKQ